MTINYNPDISSSIDDKLHETDFPSPIPSPVARRKSRRYSHSHRSSLKRHSTRRKSKVFDKPPEIVIEVPVVLPPTPPPPILRPTNPSRTNLWREVKTFKETCSTWTQFVASVTRAVLRDAGYLLLTMVISLFLVIIGSIYIADCPLCKFIPVYLLILGIFASIHQIFSYRINRQTTDFLEDHSKNLIGLRITFIILSFTVGTGTYWLVKIYRPNYDPHMGDHCNPFIYFFAMFVTVMIYTLVLVVPFFWFVYKGLRDYFRGKRDGIEGSTENI